jgi:peptidoglycan/xylan/chitin deacetylase (PgdA/CDA1 family)
MKNTYKLKSILASLLIVSSVLFPPILQEAKADQPSNLISNADLSQIDPNFQQPASWNTDSWGANSASFSFSAPTQSSPGILRLDVQNYQDGDAKWWFNPVTVTPGDVYQYNDTFQSNSVTNVWARFLNSSNSASYQWLGADQLSSIDKSGAFNFAAPTGAVSVTIFHVLSSNGYLITKSFSLVDTTPTPPPPSNCQPSLSNGIYNSSLEETCNSDHTIPAWWNHYISGQATATFDYLNTGHGGSHSTDVNLTGANGGEAGWYFKPINVSPNQRYQFSFWYNSSIYSYAYAEITASNGQLSYVSLMSAPASGNVWSQYQDTFITPSNAKSLTIYTATSGVGKVILDDFSLKQLTNYASNNFNRALVSIDFDDDWQTSYTNGLPVLNQLGLKATFYINGGTVGTKGFMTTTQVKSLVTSGEEIASHSYYHDDLVTIPFASAQNEITTNNTYLKNLTGQTIYDFATPYGSYNTPLLDTVMQYHQTQRDTSGQLNYKYSFNPRVVHSILITKSTTVAQVNALLQQAKLNGAWLVFTYHQVASGGDNYTITKAALQNQLQAIKNSGIATTTTHQAFSEIQPQL